MRHAAAALALCASGPWLAGAAAAADARVEARSASFLAVGLADRDRMTIRVSRLADNAPVADAAVTVKMRGTAHPATAEADGSYEFRSADLGLPGAAAVQIIVQEGMLTETLAGTLQPPADQTTPGDQSSARQLWWWVLNFGVCIGFLWIISRRRKAAADPRSPGDP